MRAAVIPWSPESAHLQNLAPEVGEDPEQVFPPFADAVVAAVLGIAPLRAREASGELNVRVEELQEGMPR